MALVGRQRTGPGFVKSRCRGSRTHDVATSSAHRAPRVTAETWRSDPRRGASPATRPAARLPTERRLASEFGVTRTMVRHGLATCSRPRAGSPARSVAERSSALTARGRRAPPRFERVGPADVMAARRLIEPQVLPLVVAWATRGTSTRCGDASTGRRRGDSAEEFEVWDFALHHAIVAAAATSCWSPCTASWSAPRRARSGAI